MDEKKHSARLTLKMYQDDEDNSTLITDGVVTFLNGGIYIEFGTESDSARTLIGYSEGTVTLSRLGELSYTMVLDEGKTSTVTLRSEHGDMDLSLLTERVSHQLESDRLGIELEYTMNAPLWETPVRHRMSLTGKLGGLL